MLLENRTKDEGNNNNSNNNNNNNDDNNNSHSNNNNVLCCVLGSYWNTANPRVFTRPAIIRQQSGPCPGVGGVPGVPDQPTDRPLPTGPPGEGRFYAG